MQLLHYFIFLFTCCSAVSAFSFTHGTPTQCDDISVNWSGGTAPFMLLMIPRFGTPRNISIPSSAYSAGSGSYSVQLPFAANSNFLLTMSDATGFGSGGSTTILTVGSSLGGSCNTTDPGVAFNYQLNLALQQCQPYEFSGYSSTGAILPVTIMAIIPGGDSIVLHPSATATSYTWIADVYNGTSILFVMIDAQSRQGGSSDVYTVVTSDDTSCINSSSPSSTMTPASSTTSATTTSPSASPSSSTSPGTPVGVIAGTVLGALIFLAVSITLGLFFLRRWRDKNASWDSQKYRRYSLRVRSQANLVDTVQDAPASPYQHYTVPGSYTHPGSSTHSLFPPFSQSEHALSVRTPSSPYPPNSPNSPHSQLDPFNPVGSFSEPDPFNPRTSLYSGSTTATQRKAAMAGASTYKASRFILHTDIEDAEPTDDGEEVVELPPQYSSRTTGSSSSNAKPQPSSTSDQSHNPSP